MNQLLSKRQVCDRLSIGKTTLDRWRRYRDFPAPLEVAGMNRWREVDIEAWVSANAQLKMDEGLSGPAGSGVVHADPK